MSAPRVFVHIVTHNSAPTIGRCLEGLMEQRDFTPGQDLLIHVTDNASQDDTIAEVRPFESRGVTVHTATTNLGFCAGHNQGAAEFLRGTAAVFLVLNPDLFLSADAVRLLCECLETDPSAGTACPKLLRADQNLNPISPHRLDAAGMHLTPEIRHLDRGADELDTGQFDRPAYVFGGSGACLALQRRAVESLLVDSRAADGTLAAIYPFIQDSAGVPLFDEAFFAYREDADLAWRAQILGWRCRYVPNAVGYHQRVVTPERRGALPPLLNRLSVRNRFLLQFNNFAPFASLSALVRGALWRNLLVLGALPLTERTSLGGLIEALRLMPRALHRRRAIMRRARSTNRAVARWFTQTEEPCPSS
jgi:GT2 family glycosyltransferase